MIKICCVTYGHLDNLVKQAIEEIEAPDVKFSIVEGLQDEVINGVQREITRGAEVLLAGGANATILGKTFRLPVLNYKITDFDYLAAILNGCRSESKVAVVTYQKEISGKLKEYLESQHISIQNIIYDTPKELEAEIEQSDAEVIIGAAHAVEVGERYHRQTVLIYPGIQSIVDTIYDGIQMAQEIRKIKEQNQYVNTVMHYTTYGVILIDAGERITDCNSMVLELLDIRSQPLKNKTIDSLLGVWCDDSFKSEQIKEKSYILKINGKEIFEKVIKVGENPGVFEGAVIILSKLNDVKKAQLELEKREQASRKEKGFEAKKHFSDIIGESYVIKSCIEDAEIFAKSDAGVLIYGDTGVGKELFAQGIHNNSKRERGPFIAINCGALTESLLEAELFGYDEGAFTGSKKGGKKGLFELAKGGTLFLDEIGEISPMMQTKLLRVLQEREMMRVGGERMIATDVRVIAATNQDLERIGHERFRRDLLYRLNVLELRIPPLREREKDAVLLFEYFYRQRIDVKLLRAELLKEVQELIMLYPWPGNIREMQNVSERYCLYLSQEVRSTRQHLSEYMIKAIGEEKLQNAILQKHQYDGKELTKDLITDLSQILSYSREKIAQILGSSRTTVWRVLNENKENVSKKTRK